jgi:curved DNA-binding protein CbpA
MAASRRPGEITYYEELGVENTASADDIRDAFRALVRLLHPDQQTDPQLQEMAERQMRKLNRIHAVLSDGARRAAYDASLQSRNAPIIVYSGSDDNLKRLLVRGATIMGVLFTAFLLIWFVFSSNNPSEVRGQDARVAAVTKATDIVDGAGDQITRLREQLRAAETERDSALEQLDRLSSKAPEPVAVAPKIVAARAPLPVPAAALTEPASSAKSEPVPATNAAAPSEPPVPASQFAGVWVYSKAGSASPGGKSQYPPEFIEVTVTQQDGALHGQYRSRYQVLDHAISPDVNFDFTGTPNGSALSCAWQGQGGAKGRMTLKLLPASAVEIAWNVIELGSQQWLVNGTATLTKK